MNQLPIELREDIIRGEITREINHHSIMREIEYKRVAEIMAEVAQKVLNQN